MPHIGNDIVDLTDPVNCGKSGDARFIERVFTPAEAGLISSAAEPDQVLWSMWACKEAAFKAVSKAGAISSSPRRYTVSLDVPAGDNADSRGRAVMLSGSVSTPAGEVPVKVIRSKRYVHSVTSTGTGAEMDSVCWDIGNIDLKRREITPYIHSMLVRHAAKIRLAECLNANPDDLEIVRRQKEGSAPGPPVVLVGGRQTGIEISLSHDGLFLAFAFLIK